MSVLDFVQPSFKTFSAWFSSSTDRSEEDLETVHSEVRCCPVCGSKDCGEDHCPVCGV